MDSSTLAYIDVNSGKSPFELFREWLEEAKTYGGNRSTFFSLGTSNQYGNVSNRTVVLRDFKDNFLVFLSNKNNKKGQQIAENPHIAACFLWLYQKGEKSISRQVRLEGTVEEMPRDECKKYFESEPLLAQIRAYIGKQGEKVDWHELKTKYDEILKQVKENGLKIDLPEQVTAYKISPNYFDFYYSYNDAIADRVIFKAAASEWIFDRVGT